MKLDSINKWLTLAANFGVIAGIVFLGIEIQQNTRTLQAAAIQDSINVGREQIMMFAIHGEVNRITMLGRDGLSQLTAEERQRYFWVNRSFVLGMQGFYRQWQLGVLPDEEWDMWAKIICGNTSSTGFQELWPGNAATLIPVFVKFVETCNTVHAVDGVLPEKEVP